MTLNDSDCLFVNTCSPRWRKRTSAAAASFGFRLEGRAELLHPDFISDAVAADLSAGGFAAGDGPKRRQGLRRK